MRTGTERLHRRGALTRDVEALRIDVHVGVVVGGCGVAHDEGLRRDHHAVEFDVLRGHAHRAEYHRAEPHHLLDCLHRQLRALRQEFPLLGVVTEDVDRGGHLIAGGVRACHQDARREHAQLTDRQPVAVVLGADQFRDQVVAERFAPAGDHAVDVVVEFPPRGKDVGLVFGDVPAEQLEEIVGPVGEQPPVLARGTQQRGDDRHRIGPCDIPDDLAAPLKDERIDQSVDDADDDVIEPRDRPRSECLRHESAQPGVVCAIHRQQGRGRALPQRAGGDALRFEAEPLRHLEPGVAQRGPHQVVAQDLGTVRPHRDRPLLESFP